MQDANARSKFAKPETRNPKPETLRAAFTLPDLLVLIAVLSVLAAIAIPILVKTRASSHLAQCLANVTQINRAVQLYADDHQHRLPQMSNCPAPGACWRA